MNEQNPLRTLRDAQGLTQEGLAQIIGVSRLLIIRAEQGFYTDVPPAISSYFNSSAGVIRRELNEDYHDWQTLTRKANYGILIEPPPQPRVPVGFELPQHPFILWRTRSNKNLTEVCKALCLHQGLMYKFENNPHLVESLPKPLVNALLEAGYDRNSIKNEERWYKLYLEKLMKLSKVS